MPRSLARSPLASPNRMLPASMLPDPAVPRGFGERARGLDDRWPMPLAALAIVVLSVSAWLLLAQGVRAVIGLAG